LGFGFLYNSKELPAVSSPPAISLIEIIFKIFQGRYFDDPRRHFQAFILAVDQDGFHSQV
jgi:hypothetical protein